MAEWKPKTAVPVDAWTPKTGVPVEEKTSLTAAFKEAARRNLNLFTSVGGMAGAMVGGNPGAVAGGALAEAVRQPAATLLNYPNKPPEPAGPGEILKQGAIQGGLGIGGDLIAGASKGVGNLFMRSALGRASKETASKAIDLGVMATKGGLNKAITRLGISGDAARIAAERATQRGTTISRDALATKTFSDVAPKVEENAIKQPGRDLLDKLDNLFKTDNAVSLTPTELHVMKQRADKIADPIYKAIGRGEPVGARALTRASWYKALADNIRKELSSVPGYQAANAESKQIIDVVGSVRKAIKGPSLGEKIANRSIPAVIGAGAGALAPAESYQERAAHGGGGAVLGAALSTPTAGSLIALLLSNPAFLKLLQQAPRAGAAAYQESR